MMGERKEDGSYTGTVVQILATGNLKVKVMIPFGETNVKAMETLGNKVQGYKWH